MSCVFLVAVSAPCRDKIEFTDYEQFKYWPQVPQSLPHLAVLDGSSVRKSLNVAGRRRATDREA